jgi:hypothetical protein
MDSGTAFSNFVIKGLPTSVAYITAADLSGLFAAANLSFCSVDGLVMMSSLSLVLDGILTERPPLALPPSATAAGSAATAAAASSSLGFPTATSGKRHLVLQGAADLLLLAS